MMSVLIKPYGFEIARVRCKSIYAIVLLTFWFAVFTCLLISVRQTPSRNSDIDEFDDVRSNILGALTHDDVIETSDDIIIINNDDVVHKYVKLDVTTRSELEFQDPGDLQVDTRGGRVGDGQIAYGDNDHILSENNYTFPHGDLKLPDSEKEGANYMSDLRALIYPQDRQADSQDANGADHYDVTKQPAGEGALRFDVGHVAAQDFKIPEISDDIIFQNEANLFSEGAGVPGEDFHQTVDLDPGRFSMHVTNHMIDHFQIVSIIVSILLLCARQLVLNS
jgi:hypothetical protein